MDAGAALHFDSENLDKRLGEELDDGSRTAVWTDKTCLRSRGSRLDSGNVAGGLVNSGSRGE